MRKLALAALLFCACSCAHSKPSRTIDFSDKSEQSEVGWVCVESSDKAQDWRCVDLRTFQQMVKEAEEGRSDL